MNQIYELDGYMWFIIDNSFDTKAWPKRFNDIFPSISESPDTIFFDDLSLTYTVFKVRISYFEF